MDLLRIVYLIALTALFTWALTYRFCRREFDRRWDGAYRLGRHHVGIEAASHADAIVRALRRGDPVPDPLPIEPSPDWRAWIHTAGSERTTRCEVAK